MVFNYILGDKEIMLPSEIQMDEFNELKKIEYGIMLTATREEDIGINDISFAYNEKRKCIGIFLRRNGANELIIDERDIKTDSEKYAVNSLHNELLREIDRIKMKRERWIPAYEGEEREGHFKIKL